MKILFVMLLLCSVFLVTCSASPTTTTKPFIAPSPSVPMQSTAQAATATTTPSPTAISPTSSPIPTPLPAKNAIPKLGDTLATWNTYYGSCVPIPSTQMSLCEYHDDTLTPESDIIMAYEPSQNNRVFTLSVVLNQSNRKLPALFLPTDALSLGTQNGAQFWHSRKLASEFPASYFIDSTGAPVPQGTCTLFFGTTEATLSLGTSYGP